MNTAPMRSAVTLTFLAVLKELTVEDHDTVPPFLMQIASQTSVSSLLSMAHWIPY